MNRDEAIRARVDRYDKAQNSGTSYEYAAARADLYGCSPSDLTYLLSEKSRLESDLAAMTAERDAAVRDMRIMRTCQTCKRCLDNFLGLHGACEDCDDEDKWEWRGPVAGNKEGV